MLCNPSYRSALLYIKLIKALSVLPDNYSWLDTLIVGFFFCQPGRKEPFNHRIVLLNSQKCCSPKGKKKKPVGEHCSEQELFLLVIASIQEIKWRLMKSLGGGGTSKHQLKMPWMVVVIRNATFSIFNIMLSMSIRRAVQQFGISKNVRLLYM